MKYLLFVMVILFTACQRNPSPAPNLRNGSTGYMTDERDGNEYKIINKCGKTWFAENIRYKIPGETIDTMISPLYGRYYSIIGNSQICPAGWHIPSDEEWGQLEICVGMDPALVPLLGGRGDIAPDLKSKTNWVHYGNGNNSSGMNIYPAGYLSINTNTREFSLNIEGEGVHYFTTTKNDTFPSLYILRGIYYNSDSIGRGELNSIYYYTPCRCVKD